MWAIGGGVAVSTLSGAVSTAYRIYTPGPLIWPRFLHYWMRSKTAIDQYHLLVRGITTFDRAVTRDDLDGMPVPLPPLPTQRAIADYLDRETARLDTLIAAKQRMVTLLEERRTVLLLNAVRPATAPPTWKRMRLKYLFDSVQAGTWGSDPDGNDNDVLCVRVADFDRKRFTVNESASTQRSITSVERTRRNLRAGDVLIEKSGGGEGQPVGFAVRFDLSAQAVCSNFIARLRPASEIDPRYASVVMAAAYRSGLNIPYVKQTTGIKT